MLNTNTSHNSPSVYCLSYGMNERAGVPISGLQITVSLSGNLNLGLVAFVTKLFYVTTCLKNSLC